MRGVSLEEISAATRIGTRFLEALENERWSELPGGIFNRGFIRAVAHFLGLDEESLIAEYALATSNHPEVAVPAIEPAPIRRGWIVAGAAILLALLGVCGWLAYRRFVPGLRVSRNATAQSQAAPGSPAGGPGNAPRTATNPAGTGARAADEPANLAAALDLKVDAGKPAQVKITADGKAVFSGKLSPGHGRHFQAHDRFEVTSSDASALVLELNGQVQPPLGPPGQSGSVTLTRKDVKNQSGGRD
jgi:helix-turn-helix protein/uncharacterized protein DUF4115